MEVYEKKGQLSLQLRAAAETVLAGAPAQEAAALPVGKLLHELQVSQIELEMQNEALRQTQIALEESRDRYQDLYEFAPVGYLTLAADGLIADINLTGAKLLGVERKKLLQRHFSACVTEEDRERWRRHLANAENAAIELALQRGDGTVFDALLNCARQVADGGSTTTRLALTDISARKHAERERAHSQRRIEALMKHASDCILMLDADTRIIDVSDSCTALYGYTREELLAMHGVDLRAPEVREELPRQFQKLTEAGSGAYQTWHCRKDGSRFPIQVGATMIEIDGNRYFQMIVRDISETLRQRTIMESGLAAASKRLQELSRHLVEAQEDARRRLSGELHDRTSPNLAAIQINLGMVAAALPPKAGPELTERLADTLALIEDTDASIREICADLRSPVLDHAGLPAAMESYALRYASRTGIAVQVECANPATRLAPALESLLFRIFQEALTNCLKHARAKSVRVAIELDARPVVLSIEDDGVGFDAALVGVGGGAAGMGLANMREMAEFAGGEVSIESHPGLGTRIEVRINP